MVIITFLGMLIPLGLIILLYDLESDGENTVLFGGISILLVLVSLSLGQYAPIKREYKYKKKPTLHIECNGSKCDTTYIYKFN